MVDNLIVLFTNFGLHGPYTGQMKAVLHQLSPGIPVVDLFADTPESVKPGLAPLPVASHARMIAPHRAGRRCHPRLAPKLG